MAVIVKRDCDAYAIDLVSSKGVLKASYKHTDKEMLLILMQVLTEV